MLAGSPSPTCEMLDPSPLPLGGADTLGEVPAAGEPRADEEIHDMIEVALAEGEPRLRVPRIIEKHRPNGVNATYVPVVDLETVTEKDIVF